MGKRKTVIKWGKKAQWFRTAKNQGVSSGRSFACSARSLCLRAAALCLSLARSLTPWFVGKWLVHGRTLGCSEPKWKEIRIMEEMRKIRWDEMKRNQGNEATSEYRSLIRRGRKREPALLSLSLSRSLSFYHSSSSHSSGEAAKYSWMNWV